MSSTTSDEYPEYELMLMGHLVLGMMVIFALYCMGLVYRSWGIIPDLNSSPGDVMSSLVEVMGRDVDAVGEFFIVVGEGEFVGLQW